MPSFTVTDRSNFHSSTRARATAIVLVHGFASNKEVNWVMPGWVSTLTRAGRRAIALDNRGHGASTKLYDPAEYTIETMAGDVIALLDHLGLPRADVMGYSMGGRITGFLAARHADRVRSAVIGGMGLGLIHGGPPRDNILAAMEAPSLADVTDPVGRAFRTFAEQTKSDLKALAACLRGYRQTLTRDELAGIKRAGAGRGRHARRHRRARQAARRPDPRRAAPGYSRPRPHAGGRRQGVQGGRAEISRGASMTRHIEPATALFTGAGGNRLVADVYGEEGPVVLLLHGGGQTRHAWRATTQSLAHAGWVAYALDQRGHGDSEWAADGAYAAADFAADAKAVALALAQRGGRAPVVVGASLGGIAALLALGAMKPGDPPLFSALVLVDITPRVDMSGIARIQGFHAGACGRGLRLDRGSRGCRRALPAAPASARAPMTA